MQHERVSVYARSIGESGSAYPRFRRALLTGNVQIIDAAAREIPQVSLVDALRIVVVLAEKNDPKFEAAAARWAARASIERRLSLAEARRVNALLDALPAAPEAVALTLRETVSNPRR